MLTLFKSNADRQARKVKVRRNPADRWAKTICGYCSTGCGIEVGVKDGRAVSVRGTKDHPVNQGKLCLKGIWEFEAINAPNRGTHPLMRDDPITPYRRVSWDAALTRTATEFRRIMGTY
ncbi:MAG TPA: nitrate reductase, partial [Nitrospirales bacterium]|nr:nitrate reductase [Nitrospirales bacterium]